MQEGIEEVSYDADDGDVPVWLVCVCVLVCSRKAPPFPPHDIIAGQSQAGPASASFPSLGAKGFLWLVEPTVMASNDAGLALVCVCVCV